MVFEEGTHRGAVAALEFLQRQLRVDGERLIIFVRSLSVAVAAEMASRCECRALILEARPPQVYSIRGADHNDTYIVGEDAYVQRFREFIEARSAKKTVTLSRRPRF